MPPGGHRLFQVAIRTQACTMQEKRARGVQLLRAGNSGGSARDIPR
jgi:hypothetical protein